MLICQRKFSFYLFAPGCRSNQADGEGISHILKENKFRRVYNLKKASYLIVLGCVVTEKAEKEAVRFIRKAKNLNPSIKVAVVGCLAERYRKDPISSIFFDYLISNEERKFIPDILRDKKIENVLDEGIFFAGNLEMEERSRFFFKIQEGCNASCSYCYVRFVRGKPRSLEPEKVLSHIKKLVDRNVKEIVFCGTHLGIYGKEMGYDLKNLLKEVEKIEGNFRFRLSSLEPWDIDDELLEVLYSSKKFCHFFHIPLQSGSEAILKSMNRPYSPYFYHSLILKIKKYFPMARIGADVIVGYPQEGEKEFLETYNFIKKTPVDYLHIFTYSPRPNHPVLSTLPKDKLKERYWELKKLDKLIRYEDMKKREGFISEALTLDWRGILRENYWCLFDGRKKSALLLPCKIVKWNDDKAIVEIIKR